MGGAGTTDETVTVVSSPRENQVMAAPPPPDREPDASVPLADLTEGKMRSVTIGNRRILVGLWRGEPIALDDRCPHQGARLSAGVMQPNVLDASDGERTVDWDTPVVICPWHRWEFNGEDGCSVRNSRYRVRSYPTQLNGDDVSLWLSADRPTGRAD